MSVAIGESTESLLQAHNTILYTSEYHIPQQLNWNKNIQHVNRSFNFSIQCFEICPNVRPIWDKNLARRCGVQQIWNITYLLDGS